MSGKYYYYQTTSDGRTTVLDSDRLPNQGFDRLSHHDTTEHSDTPSLTRSSTPASLSGPPTPTLTPSLSTDSKMGGRHVEFASPVSRSYRRPEWDELSVMRAFASHANHCPTCSRSVIGGRYRGGRLCDRGIGLAKDLGGYFYSYDGKPHSNIDKRRGRERVQVEVPAEYGAVKGLFQALQGGLDLRRSRPSKPDLYQASPYSPQRTSSSYRHNMDSLPTQSRRKYLDREDYDLRPARSNSRRDRDTIYRNYGGRYVETSSQSPYYQYLSDRRRPLSTPTTPLTPGTPLSKYYPSSYNYNSRRYDDASRKQSYRQIDSGRDRYSYDDRYSSRYPRYRDSYDSRVDRRYDDERRRRDSRRSYYPDDDDYRRSRRVSSYSPWSSSSWR